MGKKKKAPAPPDYTKAAKAQGIENRDTALYSSRLSNPNINNVYGSQQVTYDKDGTPTINQTLSPEQKALYDQEMRISAGMGGLAEGGVDRVGNSLGTDFDMSQIPGQAVAGEEGWQRAYDAITKRNQPFMDRQREANDVRLRNQGLMPGTEAYNLAERQLAQQENDFNLGAQQQAMGQQQAQFGMDTQARQNAIAQQAYLRQLPLNELNALRSGAQVNVPQFQQFTGQTAQAAPLFDAAKQQYDANLAQYNANQASGSGLMSGLFSLGGAALGGPMGGMIGSSLGGMFGGGAKK